MTTSKFNFPDPPADPKDGKKCVYCGSGDLIRGVTALDLSNGSEGVLKVSKDADPSALVFKGRERSETMAVVCGECGFVHLFATSPAVLKQVGGE